MVRRSMVMPMLALLLLPGPAAALSQRTFVSANGMDGTGCTLAAPCRTLQAAVNAVADGGDVIVLDSGGYGALQIHKSVNVFAPTGVYAGISVATDVAVTVSANGHVALRGLTINGGGTASRGISVVDVSELHIENTVVSGFSQEGVVSLADIGSQIFIKDSFFRDTDAGISIGFGAVATIDNVRAEHNRIGMRVDQFSRITVRNSVAAGNDTGFFAFTGNGATQSVMSLQNCMVSHNATGVEERFSIAVLDNVTVTGNTTVGVIATGGFVFSRQNNAVHDNATDVSATITALPPV